jgi:hypothetical protein
METFFHQKKKSPLVSAQRPQQAHRATSIDAITPVRERAP